MDIGMIGMLACLFIGTALIGVFAQISGREMRYKAFPPDMVGFLIATVSIAFILYYGFTAREIFEWAWWQIAVFMSISSAVTLFGYIVGYTATKRARRGDGD